MRSFDAGEALSALKDELNRPFQPLLRIYLSSVPAGIDSNLRQLLPDYEVVASSDGECALMRRIRFTSRDDFESECRRVAQLLDLAAQNWQLSAIYDESHFRTSVYTFEFPEQSDAPR
ncbi:MAG TPA: hypothetical protein VKX25_08895 [Bryobacteraceae bacterium]|jgi:hypothetical protein|nr:hypothetical protein [Bryobacteraceae bacterium]